MADKSSDAKKIRHDTAKQKYKSYQRTLSCKSFNKPEIVPCPGQFVVHMETKTQPTNPLLPKVNKDVTPKTQQFRFTKNIKLILKERNPYPVAEAINDVVNQKISNKSMKSFHTYHLNSPQNKGLRPISAQIYQQASNYKTLDQSNMIKEAYQFDKNCFQKKQEQRSNTFQVRPKLLYPKHIQGYQLVNLNDDKLTGLPNYNIKTLQNVSSQKFIIENQKELQKGKSAKFLPLQYYIIDDEDPQALMNKYRKKQSNHALGQSKWFDLKGEYIWRKCRILGFDKSSERWSIQWLHNNHIKKVSRNNLRFDEEDKALFLQKINIAQKYRERSQVFMKYNCMIDLVQTSTHQLTKYKEARIFDLATLGKFKEINKLNNNRENSLFKQNSETQLVSPNQSFTADFDNLLTEVRRLYIRSNHQAQFNSTLPYNEQRKATFIDFLPNCLFVPNSQTQIMSHSKIEISKESKQLLKKQFAVNLIKVKEKSCLANPLRLKILDTLSRIEDEMQHHRFFKLTSKHKLFSEKDPKQADRMSLQQFMEMVERQICEMLYTINCRICDIEHLVGTQLDPIYLQKHIIGQQSFNKIIANYRKFLYLVDSRLQNLLEKILLNTVGSILQPFIEWNHFASLSNSQFNQETFRKDLAKYNAHSLYKGIKIKLHLHVRQGKLEVQPQIHQIKHFLLNILENLIQKISDLNCVTKSYIDPVRPQNKLRVLISGCTQVPELKQIILSTKQKYLTEINKAFFAVEKYIEQTESIVTQISNINSDAKKRVQKKGSYAQFAESIEMANNMNRKIDNLISKESMEFIILSIDCEDVLLKQKAKVSETMKDVYRMLCERISKENQKLEKHIESVIFILQKEPKNIEEMLQLEDYANRMVSEEIQKINSKVHSITQRVVLLQKTGCKVQYKDFQSCYRIYTKPLGVSRKKTDCLHDIEHIHKKTFGEELSREGVDLLEEIKECEQKVQYCIDIKDIKEMQNSFLAYSRLNERLQNAFVKMNLINQRQQKMNWRVTNFGRLQEIREEFGPYFKLISLAKNFNYQIQPQMQEPFFSIDANFLKNQIHQACSTLQLLEGEVFANNPKILKIVTEILAQYVGFKKYLPMIMALRSHDLKQRHWTRIKKVTRFNEIQSEDLTITELLKKGINNYTESIEEISSIASKQLTYEKQLNKLKKEWKEVKLTIGYYKNNQSNQFITIHSVKQDGGSEVQEAIYLADKRVIKEQPSKGCQNFKVIQNLSEVHLKAENDIYNVQSILSSSFIKFLEADIVGWRNSILYKTYEVIEVWQRLQEKLVILFGLFSNKQTQEQIPSEYLKFKSIQKTWRSNILQIESQPSIIQLLQSKTTQNMKYIEEMVEDIEHQIEKYFECKKQSNIRMNALSNQELMKAYSITGHYGTRKGLDQFITKCFTGISNITREVPKVDVSEIGNHNSKKPTQKDPQDYISGITSVQTYLYEKMTLDKTVHEVITNNFERDYVQLDKILQNVDKQITNKLVNTLMLNWLTTQQKTPSNLHQTLLNKKTIVPQQKEFISQQCSQKSQRRPLNGQIQEKEEPIQQIRLLRKRIELTFDIEQNLRLGLGLEGLTGVYMRLAREKDAALRRMTQDGNICTLSRMFIQICNGLSTVDMLIKQGVTKVDQFAWQSQIRTYMRPNSLNSKLPQVIVIIGIYQSKYRFSLVKSQDYVTSLNSSKMFFSLAMTLKERMMVSIEGGKNQGKTVTINYLCELLGKEVNTVYCHSLMNPKTILSYLRMSTSGLWVNLKNINHMPCQMLNVFSSALQIVWSSIKICQKRCSLTLGDTIINCQPQQFGMFATIQKSFWSSKHSVLPPEVRDYFRTINHIEPDYTCLVSVLLSGQSFVEQNLAQKIIAVCEEVSTILRDLDEEPQYKYVGRVSKTTRIKAGERVQHQASEKIDVHKPVGKITSYNMKQGQDRNIDQLILKENRDASSKLKNCRNFNKMRFIKIIISSIRTLQQDDKIYYLAEEKKINSAIGKALKNSVSDQDIRLIIIKELNKYYKLDIAPDSSHQNRSLPPEETSFDKLKSDQMAVSKESNTKLLYQKPNKFEFQESSQIAYINKGKLQLQEYESVRQIVTHALLQSKLYFNNEIVTAFQSLFNLVKFNKGVIVLSEGIVGKSTLINALQNINSNNFSIKIRSIHPMSMDLKQLHGSSNETCMQEQLVSRMSRREQLGVFNHLLSDVIKESVSDNSLEESEKNSKTQYRGIHLDSNFSSRWYQPLISLLNNDKEQSTVYHFSNGGSISISPQSNVRLIFEATTLAQISPHFLSQVVLLPFKANIKWQNLFSSHIRTNFNFKYQNTDFIGFLQLMVPFIMDPVLQFYENSFKPPKLSNTKIERSSLKRNSLVGFSEPVKQSVKVIQIVGICLRMFQSLLSQYFPANTAIQEIVQYKKSDLFNLFMFAIIWTVGVLMPQLSKSTFSRHFKYLIKRAVQINIRGIDKTTLPQDEQSIYDIYYCQGAWKSWQELSVSKGSTLNGYPIISPDYTRIFHIMEKYINQGISIFLVGPPSSSKNFLFKEYLNSLNSQKFSSTAVSFSPVTRSQKLKDILVKLTARDKYSDTIKGLVSGKTTIIYICDMNLPSIKIENCSQAASNYIKIVEFLRQFYISGSIYLQDSSKPHIFRNLSFCGTLNSQLNLPSRILRYMNPLILPPVEGKLKTVLQHSIKEEIGQVGIAPLSEVCRQKLVRWVSSVHEIMKREYANQSQISFIPRDLIKICLGVMYMVDLRQLNCNSVAENDKQRQMDHDTEAKHYLLRRWIYQSECIYSQKMSSPPKDKLFYYLNNVIMEQERDRYKRVMPHSNIHITNLRTQSHFEQITVAELRQFILQAINEKQLFQEELLRSENYKLPLEFFITDELVVNLVKLFNGLSIESPIAICINKRTSSIKAITNILGFLKGRNTLNFKVNKNGYEGHKEWLEFVKERLLQKLENYQDVTVLVEISSDSQQSSKFNSVQYILDDLLSLKRIGNLNSLLIAQQERTLQEYDKFPFKNLKPNRQEQFQQQPTKNHKKRNSSNLMALEKQVTDEEQSPQISSSLNKFPCHKIWTILHYKQKSENLFKYYQSLLGESTVLWMTDQLGQSHYETRMKELKGYLRLNVKRIPTQQYADKSYLSTSTLIEDMELCFPALENFHQKIIKSGIILPHILQEPYLNMELYFSFINTFTQVYSNLSIKSHEKLTSLAASIKSLQTFDNLCAQTLKKLSQLQELQKHTFQKFKSISGVINSQQKDYKLYKEQNQDLKQALAQKQKAQREHKHVYEQQMMQKKKQLQQWKAEMHRLVTKDKKIALTGQLKAQFQLLATVLGKKRQGEDSFKEILKQFTTQKILRRIQSFQPHQFPDKMLQKVKVLLQKINKFPKKDTNSKEALVQETDVICNAIKRYVQALVECYEKHKTLLNIWTKMHQLTKQIEQLRSDLEKKSRNKAYLQIMQKYQGLTQKLQKYSQQLIDIRNRAKIFQDIIHHFQKLAEFKHEYESNLKAEFEREKNKCCHLLDFAFTLSIKIRYQAICDRKLTSQIIHKITNQNQETSTFLSVTNLEDNSQLQIQDHGLKPQQCQQLNFLSEETYNQQLKIVMQELNSLIAKKPLSIQEFYLQTTFQKGVVLIEKNPNFDEWIEGLYSGNSEVCRLAINLLVKKIPMKNLSHDWAHQLGKSLARDSMDSNDKQQQKKLTNNITFIRVENQRSLEQLLNENIHNFPNNQLTKTDQNSIIVVYFDKFSTFNKCKYPYFRFQDMPLEEVALQCRKIIDPRKDSQNQLEGRMQDTRGKLLQKWSEIQQMIGDINDQIILPQQIAIEQSLAGSNELYNNDEKVDFNSMEKYQKLQRQDITSKNENKQPRTKINLTQTGKLGFSTTEGWFNPSIQVGNKFKELLKKAHDIKESQIGLEQLKKEIEQSHVVVNNQNCKLIGFCSKFYFGLYKLYEMNMISCRYELRKYLKILREILIKQKESKGNPKGRTSGNSVQKLESSIKKHLFGELIWQDESRTKGVIIYTFMAVASMQNWEDLKIWDMIELGFKLSLDTTLPKHLTEILLNNHERGQLTSQQLELLEIYEAHLLTHQQTPNPYISQSQSFTPLFKLVLSLAANRAPTLLPIIQDILKNQYKWVLFFLSISERTSKLPEPFQTYGRVYLVFFLCLFKGESLEKWLVNYGDNMGSVTYSANVLNNNTYLPLHVRLSNNVNSNFVWAGHWAFQNSIRRFTTIQKELEYNCIILVNAFQNYEELYSQMSVVLRLIVQFTMLMKRPLQVVNSIHRSHQQIFTVIEQAMKSGSWVYIDSTNTDQTILKKIPDFITNFKSSGNQVHQEYMLLVSCTKNQPQNKKFLKIKIQGQKCSPMFTISYEQLLKHFDGCIMSFGGTMNRNGYTDFNPINFYESQSVNKKLRKQYDSLQASQKVQIYNVLTFYHQITSKTNEAEAEMLSTNEHCGNLCSLLFMISHFNQESTRGSILNNCPTFSQQEVKDILSNKLAPQYASSHCRDSSKPFITQNLSIKFQNYMECIKRYYSDSLIQNMLKRPIRTSRGIKISQQQVKILEDVKRHCMDDLTRNLCQQVDYSLLLRKAKQKLSCRLLRSALTNCIKTQEMVQPQLLSVVHCLYYKTLHLHDRITRHLAPFDMTSLQSEQNPMIRLLWNECNQFNRELSELKILLQNLRSLYQNLRKNCEWNNKLAPRLKDMITQITKYCQDKQETDYQFIVNRFGWRAQKLLLVHHQLMRNLKAIIHLGQGQQNTDRRLSYNISYHKPLKLIQALRKMHALQKKLAVDELILLIYVNKTHSSENHKQSFQNEKRRSHQKQKLHGILVPSELQNQQSNCQKANQINIEISSKVQIGVKNLDQKHQNKVSPKMLQVRLEGCRLTGARIQQSKLKIQRQHLKETSQQQLILNLVFLQRKLEQEQQDMLQRMKRFLQTLDSSIAQVPILIESNDYQQGHTMLQLSVKVLSERSYQSSQLCQLGVFFIL